jgi:hypothetical protein
MINTIFYISILLFIWSEIYHLCFRDKLYVEYNNRKNMPRLSNLFYFIRLYYIVCMMISLFTSIWLYSALIVISSSIKLIPMILKLKANSMYDTISTILSISILSSLLLCKLFFWC